MPTSIIVIAAVAAVIVFLILMRVKVCVGYSGDFDFAIKYMFLTFGIKNRKKGQAKQVKKVKAKKENKQPVKFTFEQLRGFIDIFERFYDDAKKVLLKVKKKARIDSLAINLTVGGEDAANVAITYGEACAVIFPAVSALEMLVKVKKKRVFINADFNGAANIDFDCCASMRLGGILALGISSAVKILISLIKNPIHIGQRGVVK